MLEILRREIAALEAAGIAAPGFIELRRGAGAYICGEESAMIESIEGKRGLPRNRPPYIAEVGIFGRPTLNQNVETLWWIRDILQKGADWFAKQGKEGHPGPRSWSVSGRVKKPGVVQAPAGVTVRELIDDYCGGMLDGHEFTAYLPGGASGGILPASMGDIPLDFGGELAKVGAFVGSHAVVVFSDHDDVKDAVINLLKFFRHESCGQCTPCREGTDKIALYVPGWDCHGLPIENQIEKTYGRNLPRDEVQAKSRAYATEQIAQQMADFKRLGVLGDWDHPYRTMDFGNEAGEIRALKRVMERGFVYRGLEAGVLVLRLRLVAGRVRDRVRRQDLADGGRGLPAAPSPSKLAAAFGLPTLAQAGLRRDLDHDAVDAPGQPGAQPEPGARVRAGRHRARPAAARRGAGRASAWRATASRAR